MIDFSPLYETLKEKGLKMKDLRNTVVSPDTLANINKAHLSSDPKIYLGTIEKICLHLDVPIEKVVQITQNTDTMVSDKK